MPLKVKLKCDIDCKYRVRLERHPRGSTTLSVRGTALAGVAKDVALPARRVARGDYRFTVTLTASAEHGTADRARQPPHSVALTSMQGQYVAYTFFKVSPGWRRLPVEERAAGKEAFAEVIEDWAGRLEHLHTYSTAGVRADSDFFVWKITERYLDFEELGTELNATPLAGWLDTPYSYLATTKASQYTSARRARKVVPRGSPYLVVYPFVKVRPWYALPDEDRQRAMDEHIAIGASFPSIHNHTTYSFGIDDQEFMTAFECDEPADFMHLMLTLRESEASRYTERDTPIFVGHKVEIREALDQLDGAVTRTTA